MVPGRCEPGQLDPNDPDTVYVALFGYGVWRRSPALDGTTQFRQVFQTHFPGDTFGTGPSSTSWTWDRIRGSTSATSGDPAALGPVADETRPTCRRPHCSPAARTVAGLLSDPANGSVGFGSYFFCHFQCDYDMFVESPPGQPDTVWIGAR